MSMQSLPSPRQSGGLSRRRVVIVGAAGRDFHNFNVVYRDDAAMEVVVFTQISGIAERRYPPALAGRLYPDGIAIVDEWELEVLCRARSVDEVVFAYSDVPHEHVMHVASRRSRPAPTSHCSGRSGPCSRRPCRSLRSLRCGPVAESLPSRAGCRSGCGNAKSVARSRANMRWSSLTAMDRR